MAYLVFEEGSPRAQLSLSLNGLPLALANPLRPGDLIRLGEAILRYSDAPSAGLSAALREPDAPYSAGGPVPRPGEDPRADLIRSPDLVAEAPCMRRLLEQIRKVASHGSNVMLFGESGTGKEVVAQAIQANGVRANRPFVAVNAAALPESVLESELFGHERGAFTGAIARRQGLFELASTGTLFLDELGELPLTTQAKLLRVLETGEFRRVGGSETVRVDVRVIAATNRDLHQEVIEGRFREDLFFRLAVISLQIPPLRERPEDLEPLIQHLLTRLAKTDPAGRVALAPEALEALRAYPFPGNVRELRNVLEAALNFCEGGVIRLADLPQCVLYPVRREPEFPTLAAIERRHVEAALYRARWNKSRAAALLGIDRKTLYQKIESYGLKPTSPPPPDGPDARDSSSQNATS